MISVEKHGQNSFELIINYMEDSSLHGYYEIYYEVWFDEDGNYSKKVAEPLILNVVDECQELAGEYDYEGANGLVD